MPSAALFKSIKVFDHDYAYLDSGAPISFDYTTWVILHRMGFNGAVFQRLFPLAREHNIRVVSVNRRGYPPSSGFREDELERIGFGKKFEEAEPFFRSQGIEIATFLAQFATGQGIPLAKKDSTSGGIVLIGWSLGTLHPLTVLAFVDESPQKIQSTLRKYLHTVFAHDTVTFTLGLPNPEILDSRHWLETDDRKRFEAFCNRATAHYIHKSVTSGNIDDLEFSKPSDAPHSLRELSYEQRIEYTHLEAFTFTGCDGKLFLCDPRVIVKRALFDKARARVLPNVRVRYMSGGTSEGVMIWPLWVLQKHLKDPRELYGFDAETARDIKMINQEQGNHFTFWEDPEKAIEQYTGTINL